jgi:hypothetical protein
MHLKIGDIGILGGEHAVEAEECREWISEVLQANVDVKFSGIQFEVYDFIE